MSEAPAQFQAAFSALRSILAAWEKPLRVVQDTAEDYHLDTHHIMKNKKPLFFGAVQTRKRYVSYHLMPVYVNPGLLTDTSETLRKRMQGKSCFNFKRIDDALFAELATLTERGFDFYVQEGYISRTK